MSLINAAFFTAAAIILATSADAGPNLVAKINTKTGMVKVSNIGTDPAGRSVVTVGCASGGSTDCPEAPAAMVAPYQLPGFPDVAAIKVPALDPGKSFQHKINFFNNLNWQPGTYYLGVCADAGNHVAETNEADNCKKFKKIVN